MKHRTDDAVHKVRLVYLGPKGTTLPIELTYAQIGVGGLFIAVLLMVSYALFGMAALGLAAAVGVFLTFLVFRHVSYDRRARDVLYTVATDWTQRQLPADGRGKPVRLATTHLTGGDHQ